MTPASRAPNGSLPEDLPAFSQTLYELCPDIVDQGVGAIESLQAAVEQEGAIFLWWDWSRCP